jgi:hypothetical protein
MKDTLILNDHAETWRRALLATVVITLACAPVSWIMDGITPSFIVYPILMGIGLLRVARGSSGAVYFAVAATIFLIVHLPFTWAAVSASGENPFNHSSPYNPGDWVVSCFVVPLMTLVCALAIWRTERTTGNA